LAIVSTAHAEIIVPDDAGRTLTLASPARRIVSLAPNVTELLYVAGAGNFVVGAVAYSDYPEAAKSIPRVGSGAGLDIEAIVALHPDLVIAWQTGNPTWQVERLIALGMPVFVTEPHHLDDVADLLERLGRLAGTETLAGKTVVDFRQHLARLRARYSERPVVPVFYQILDSSLLTISRRHLINDVIQLCGGRNVYADLPGLTPRVDVESMVQRNPELFWRAATNRYGRNGVTGGEPGQCLSLWRKTTYF
jgi:iron complex transport system substrate-binding protein